MAEYADNPETGEVTSPHFDRDGQPLPGRPESWIRHDEEVAYGIQIQAENGWAWIDTYWRDYATPQEAGDFADAIFTGRRNWRIVKRTVITVVEVHDIPVTGNGS